MRRNRKKTKKNRSGLYLVMLVVGLFLGALTIQGVRLQSGCEELAQEQARLEEKKKSLEEEKNRIKEQEAYTQTDEYIEEVAREKFGLVYDNEIIFKPEE